MRYHYLNNLSDELINQINESLNKEFVNIEPKDLAKSNSIAIIATENNHLAGYTILSRRKTCYYIVWIVTLPAYRGRGIARNIMRHAMRMHNCLTLFVEPNTIAEQLYTKLGFKRTGKYRDLPDDRNQLRRMYHMRWKAQN